MSSTNLRNLSTPFSLYSGYYGYHPGSLIYRGTFIANGSEESIYLPTERGYAYRHSVWLNATHIATWSGSAEKIFHNQSIALGSLEKEQAYVITILIDYMGNDENWPANVAIMKDPRGLLDYDLVGRSKTAIKWKITGNLGGERFADISRGPFNEGGFFVKRQGYHLPGAPVHKLATLNQSAMMTRISSPGLGFWAASFDLNLPAGYGIPISVVFSNSTSTPANPTGPSLPAKFRSVLFIKGWQFGKCGMLFISSCRVGQSV